MLYRVTFENYISTRSLMVNLAVYILLCNTIHTTTMRDAITSTPVNTPPIGELNLNPSRWRVPDTLYHVFGEFLSPEVVMATVLAGVTPRRLHPGIA